MSGYMQQKPANILLVFQRHIVLYVSNGTHAEINLNNGPFD